MEPVTFGVQGVRLHGEYHVPKASGTPGRGRNDDAHGGDKEMHGDKGAHRPDPKGAVVLVHGFNSNLEEFGALPAALAAAGFPTLAFDQRGFGKSEGERGRTSRERAVEDIRAATTWLQGMVGKAPLGIVGHSLGGAYALAAIHELKAFRCAVVAHPVDSLFAELNPVQRMAYHFLGKRGERRTAKGRLAGAIPYKVHYSEIFESWEAAQEAKRDEFLQKQANLANYRDALAVTGSVWAGNVDIPVLCVASALDRAVKPMHSKAVFAALKGPKQAFEHQGGHSCFRDFDGKRVIEATAQWFGEHLGGTK